MIKCFVMSFLVFFLSFFICVSFIGYVFLVCVCTFSLFVLCPFAGLQAIFCRFP
jgi:hypothetical protein